MVYTTKYCKSQPKKRTQRFSEGGSVRSERTEYERARRGRDAVQPVSVLEDLVGRFDEEKGSSNATRDAMRENYAKKMRETGYKPKLGPSGKLDDVE